MKDAPYLALTGKLWGVFRELYEEHDRHVSRAHRIKEKFFMKGDTIIVAASIRTWATTGKVTAIT